MSEPKSPVRGRIRPDLRRTRKDAATRGGRAMSNAQQGETLKQQQVIIHRRLVDGEVADRS